MTETERALIEQNILVTSAFASTARLVIRMIDRGELLDATVLLREAEEINDRNITLLTKLLNEADPD